MPPLTVELGTLLLEVLGVLGAVCVVVAVLRSSGQSQLDVRLVAGGVVAAITLTLALGGLADADWSLNQIRRTGVGARAGLESCLTEQGGPAVAVRLQFINWVKARLPADAVYQLLPYTPPPDDLVRDARTVAVAARGARRTRRLGDRVRHRPA